MNTDPDIQTVPPRQSNEAFKVLLLGNCNSGKTSLINALVGRVDFLPTDYLPTTGVVTEVVYGNHHGMTIYP